MITYPFPDLPPPGTTIQVAPGVHWLRMPLPFALNHINLWLLKDGNGWCIVDTGYGVETTWQLWDQHFAGTLGGKPVKRIVVTHYHPDHVGSAAWLEKRTGAPVLMTEAEYLAAWAARENIGGWSRASGLALFANHGLDAQHREAQAARSISYQTGVPDLPHATQRLFDGEMLTIDGRAWNITTVFGHAPEHATLYCDELRVLISGDQVLPRITTNVGVWGNHPDDDPLRQFLSSMRKFAHLPENTLVLPSHDRPFHGLHERITQLHAHHQARLDELLAACAEPRTAMEVLPVLFKRQLDNHQLVFAMGESIAHLNHLWRDGKLKRTKDASAVWRFQRTNH